MEKGKILKIRFGHEANCSSGMIMIIMLYVSAFTHLPTAIISSAIQAQQARNLGEISKATKWTPQVFGLIITFGLFFFGANSGYDGLSLGLMAFIFGGGFAVAVYIGSLLAPKIGYWNILVIPLIQVSSVILIYFGMIYISMLFG